jgi:hypothetical protein
LIPDVNVDQLVYFGTSIFWRASLGGWRVNGKLVEMMRLGSLYEEQFRQYLNGEAKFPANAVLWVAVIRSEHPPPVISFPTGERVGSYHRHTFDVLGLSYMLYVGRGLPEEIRQLCAFRSPSRYMFFTDISPIIERNARGVFNDSRPSRKLVELTGKNPSELPETLRDQMASLTRARSASQASKSPRS